MSYTEQFDEAVEKDGVEAVSQDIFTWDEEDQTLIGELVDIQPFTEGEFDTDVNAYIFDTDHGRVSTVLGAAADKRMAEHVEVGDLLRIIYRGKKNLEGGRQVNKFEIQKAT